MFLTDDQKRMFNGEYGVGTQKSIDLLIRFGNAFGAEKLVKVNYAQISTNIPNTFLKEMTEGIDRCRTICSLHAVFDPQHWREKHDLVAKHGESIAGGMATTDEKEFTSRLGRFREIGFLPTFTCMSYLIGIIPRIGDICIWTGSSGQVFCNSFFGAKTNREGMPSALASAITGLTPEMGYLLKDNRYAQVLIKVEDLDIENWNVADYGALGYFIGSLAGARNAVVVGLPKKLSFEQCKYLTSPMPVSGTCIMCHIVGVTPEAPTLEVALNKKKLKETAVFGRSELRETYDKLNTGDVDAVDLVVLGCPHLTIGEIGEIASMLYGKKINKNLRLMIGASNPTYTLASDTGYSDIIENAGGFFENVCTSVLNPLLFIGNRPRIVATNSARAAHFIVRVTSGKTRVYYGNTVDCINAAISGKWGG